MQHVRSRRREGPAQKKVGREVSHSVVNMKKNRDDNFFVDRDGEETSNDVQPRLDKWTNVSGAGGASKS